MPEPTTDEQRFAPWPRHTPFGEAAGPLLVRSDDGGLVFAVRISEEHTNARGTAHGGMLSAVADNVLGYAAALSTDPPTPSTTISLSIDFISPVKVGELLVIEPTVLKVGSRVAFARGELRVADRPVATASSVLMVTREPPAESAKG